MNTASIVIRTDPDIKTKAEKTAKAFGISLDSLLNNYLKHFVKTQSITFITEELTSYAKKELKQAVNDRKTGKASPIFHNAKDAQRTI